MTSHPYQATESDLEQDDGSLTANPHVLWRQVVGFVFWTGLVSFLGGGIVGVAMGLVLGGVTFADAWRSGIYKDPKKSSFVNISPMAWGIVMALLFIVAYPMYLVYRNKLRTRNAGSGFFVATVVLGAAQILLILTRLLGAAVGKVG
jgi:hypothetical protein